jgi:hypothetical protein
MINQIIWLWRGIRTWSETSRFLMNLVIYSVPYEGLILDTFSKSRKNWFVQNNLFLRYHIWRVWRESIQNLKVKIFLWIWRFTAYRKPHTVHSNPFRNRPNRACYILECDGPSLTQNIRLKVNTIFMRAASTWVFWFPLNYLSLIHYVL